LIADAPLEHVRLLDCAAIKRQLGGAADLPALDWSQPIQFTVSFRKTPPRQRAETKSASQ
jgi:hypothetical protein